MKKRNLFVITMFTMCFMMTACQGSKDNLVVETEETERTEESFMSGEITSEIKDTIEKQEDSEVETSLLIDETSDNQLVEETTTELIEETTSKKQQETTSKKQQETTSKKQQETTSKKQQETTSKKQQETTSKKQQETTSKKQQETASIKQQETTVQENSTTVASNEQQTQKPTEEVTDAIQEVVNEVVTSDMTDFEKIVALKNWMFKHFSGDKVFEANFNGTGESDPYKILETGNASVKGYGYIYEALLKKAGLSTKTEEDGKVIVTKVKLDNCWYDVDIFSMIYENGCSNPHEPYGFFNHFLVSDEEYGAYNRIEVYKTIKNISFVESMEDLKKKAVNGKLFEESYDPFIVCYFPDMVGQSVEYIVDYINNELVNMDVDYIVDPRGFNPDEYGIVYLDYYDVLRVENEEELINAAQKLGEKISDNVYYADSIYISYKCEQYIGCENEEYVDYLNDILETKVDGVVCRGVVKPSKEGYAVLYLYRCWN